MASIVSSFRSRPGQRGGTEKVSRFVCVPEMQRFVVNMRKAAVDLHLGETIYESSIRVDGKYTLAQWFKILVNPANIVFRYNTILDENGQLLDEPIEEEVIASPLRIVDFERYVPTKIEGTIEDIIIERSDGCLQSCYPSH